MLLQNVTAILLQNASGFLLQNATVLIQNATVVTKCNVYSKLRRYTEHQALIRQGLDQQCDSLTLVKTDVQELKESLSFTQNDKYQSFLNINEKVQSLKIELSSTKEDVGVIQKTEPTWELEIRREFVDIEDRSRRSNLRILGIKEDPRESWEECENKIYDLLEEKLEMDTSNIMKGCIMLEESRTIKKGQ